MNSLYDLGVGGGNDLTPAAFLAVTGGHQEGFRDIGVLWLSYRKQPERSGHLEARVLRNCLAFAHRTC